MQMEVLRDQHQRDQQEEHLPKLEQVIVIDLESEPILVLSALMQAVAFCMPHRPQQATGQQTFLEVPPENTPNSNIL